jgi:hypothetical protein
MEIEDWLIIASAAFVTLAYLLWLVERLPRFRVVLVLLALVSFTLTLVTYDRETEEIVAATRIS